MSRSLCLDSLSDHELLRRLSALVDRHRRLESEVVAHIAEVDSRKLYRAQACSSMHAYCCEVLHLSEAEAYLRIAVARASRRFPIVLDMLADGRLHLSAIAKLAPHLSEGNAEALLQRAVHRTKREIELLVAEVAPRPDVPARMRKLPRARSGGGQARPDPGNLPPPASQSAMRPTGSSASDLLRPDAVQPPAGSTATHPGPARRAVLEPIAPARYKVEFTASAELHDKLCRARALLRHKVPDGDLGDVIDEAVTQLLGKLEARRFGKTETPKKTLADTDTSASSRHIPAAIKRAVYERDGGQCAFVDQRGRRCSCTDPGKLEYHHVTPYAMGGDHRPESVALRCRTHNQHQAELDFGAEKMERERRGASRAREPQAPYGSQPTEPIAGAASVADRRGAEGTLSSSIRLSSCVRRPSRPCRRLGSGPRASRGACHPSIGLGGGSSLRCFLRVGGTTGALRARWGSAPRAPRYRSLAA